MLSEGPVLIVPTLNCLSVKLCDRQNRQSPLTHGGSDYCVVPHKKGSDLPDGRLPAVVSV